MLAPLLAGPCSVACCVAVSVAVRDARGASNAHAEMGEGNGVCSPRVLGALWWASFLVRCRVQGWPPVRGPAGDRVSRRCRRRGRHGVGLSWCWFVVFVCGVGLSWYAASHGVALAWYSRVGLVLVSCWVVLVLSMRTLHLRLSAYVALIRKAMWQAQRMLDDAPPWCASSLPPRTRMRVRAVWAYRAYRARTEMEHHWARK